MIDPSYRSAATEDLGGADLLSDITDIPLSKAVVSQNVRFLPGQVGTRLGFSQAFSTAEAITAMFNWISSLGNLLVWYNADDGSIRYIDIASPSELTMVAGDLDAYAATFAPAGARLFTAFFNYDGSTPSSGARVITFQGGGFVSDLALPGPITYVPGVPVEVLGGSVTAGLHYFGYMIEYRSGFIGRFSPDSGVGFPSVSTFTPIQQIATGGKYFTWDLTTTWPDGAVAVYPVMTTAADLATWFIVPGQRQDVVGGASSTISFVINIPDDLLASSAQNVTENLYYLTNSVSGTAVFKPTRVFSHGNRMVYVTEVADNVGNMSGALYVSAIGKYEAIDASRSLIQIPGLLDIITGFSMDGSLYIVGPQWTYRTSDNNSLPSTWPTPILVDGRRGTLAVRGVEVAPAGTYAWVAGQEGFYFFPGYYPALPISYYQQPDWDRINWTAAAPVSIKDDPSVNTVYVTACLDGETSPNYILSWDYTRGFQPHQVQYSIVSYQQFPIGAIEVVKNGLPGTPTGVIQRKELWVGSSTVFGIIRRNSVRDTNPFLDITYPIFAAYETSLFPQSGPPGDVWQHHGAIYRLTGSGTLGITVYELGHAGSQNLLEVDLSIAPRGLTFRGFDLISEGVTHLLSQGMNLVSNPDFEDSSDTVTVFSGSTEITIGALAAGDIASRTMTVPGALLGMMVIPGWPALEAGLVPLSMFVSATGVVVFRVLNATGAPITIATHVYAALAFLTIGTGTIYEGSGVIDLGPVSSGDLITATFTVAGAVLGMKVVPGWPVLESGLIPLSMYVSAPDTLTVQILNVGAPLNPIARTYSAQVFTTVMGVDSLSGSASILLGTVLPGGVALATIPVIDAVPGMWVAPGWPVLEAGLTAISMWVSANDVVSLQVMNISPGAITPLVHDFSAEVFHV